MPEKFTLKVADSYSEMSRQAADFVINIVKDKPDAVLGLPTGATPKGLYAELREAGQAGEISFADVTTFNIDDYVGLPKDHPASFNNFMQKYLFEQVDFQPDNIHFFDSMAEDPEAECRRYEKEIRKAGGVDLMILGIGVNGHLAYNEPGTPLDSRAHVATLTQSSKEGALVFFDSLDEVPDRGLTLGLGSIMDADKILLLANGKKKAKAIAEALAGPVSPEVPASVLQKHPFLTVMLDAEAASELKSMIS